MPKVKIELNSAGVRELLKSDGIMAALNEAADPIMSRLGDGYARDTHTGKNRCNVGISTETPEAMQDNLDNNTLLKAVGGR